MKLIKPSVEVLKMDDIKLIELAGRTCYKSEDKITEGSAKKFVKMLIERGHEAMVEHAVASVKVVCDRGVSHEIVRHRLFSFAQESTRYCNYGKNGGECSFIIPLWYSLQEGEYVVPRSLSASRVLRNNHGIDTFSNENEWLKAISACNDAYLNMLSDGYTPQQARAVLPNSLKTEIVITGNFREWRHFFKLRCAKESHPQMVEVANMIVEKFEEIQPDMIWR